MCMSTKAPKMPDPPPATPRLPDEGVQMARQDEKRRQRMMAGRKSTILTGNRGASGGYTAGNTLLGG